MSGATFEVDPSWPTIEELAVRLWGKVTGRYQGGNELRFGAKELKSVRVKELTWFDNETQEGGGYIRLWSQLYPGTPLPPRTGIPRPDATPRPKPNGHDATGAGKPNGKHAPRDPNRPPVWEDVGPVQYDYHDATGTTVLQVYRTISGAPRFRQRSPNGTYRDGKPKWKYKVQHVPGHDTMLYHFPELLQSGHATVFITEGEKDCDNVIKLGLNATTNIGGAGKWRRENARWFLRKPVVILSDNDPQSVHQVTGELLWHPDGRPVLVGQDHAEDVARALHGTAMSVKVLHLPDLPIKGDVSDWIEAGGTRDELERLARDLDEWTPPPEPPGAPEQPPATEAGPRGPNPPPPEGGEGGGRGDDGRPIIACIAGEFPRMVRQAEASLMDWAAPIYQRGALVQPAEQEYLDSDGHVTHSASLVTLTQPSLTKAMASAATYLKYNATSEAWVPCHPPDKLVDIVLFDRIDWPFPVVRGVLTCPTLRADGSVLSKPGYDPASRYFMMFPSDLVLPEIPDEPTIDDARDSLARLETLLVGYPFVNTASKSVAVTILMTQVLRCAMAVSPLLAVSAKAPGTGKSHLVDLASTIAIGRPCPSMGANSDKKETEKEISTMLMSGVSGFTIDNVSSDIDLPLLNRATSQKNLTIRVFGKLESVEVQNSVVIYMTGNNLAIVDEQGRRSMRCDMDAGEEHPERRPFDGGDPIAIVRADRGRYIADILIISRAFHLSGAKVSPFKLGGFEDWSRFVREPLIWLGKADPADTMETTAADDPAAQRLTAMLDAWEEQFPHTGRTIPEAIRELDADALRDVMREHFPNRSGEIDAVRIAYWLRKFVGRVMNGKRFVKDGAVGGVARWKVERVAIP